MYSLTMHEFIQRLNDSYQEILVGISMSQKNPNQLAYLLII